MFLLLLMLTHLRVHSFIVRSAVSALCCDRIDCTICIYRQSHEPIKKRFAIPMFTGWRGRLARISAKLVGVGQGKIKKTTTAQTHKGRPKAALLTLLGCKEPVGAGEEIRTLDPNLGKVMLYP
tara:strand:- start:1791 stop:2159 length:369 start_codon:yes stop_codon:yes gene_type:complete